VVLAEHAPRPALICREEKLGAHGGPQIKNAAGTSHLAWNFEEFNTNINATARGLLTMGVKPGDRVAVIMGNNRYWAPFCHHWYALRQYLVHTQCSNGRVQALVLFLSHSTLLTELTSLYVILIVCPRVVPP
jgi:long-subunit acyl-CoA synthetase (AMP-forming)